MSVGAPDILDEDAMGACHHIHVDMYAGSRRSADASHYGAGEEILDVLGDAGWRAAGKTWENKAALDGDGDEQSRSVGDWAAGKQASE